MILHCILYFLGLRGKDLCYIYNCLFNLSSWQGGFRLTFNKKKNSFCFNAKGEKLCAENFYLKFLSVQVEITQEGESISISWNDWKCADSLRRFFDICSQSKRHFPNWKERKLVNSMVVLSFHFDMLRWAYALQSLIVRINV